MLQVFNDKKLVSLGRQKCAFPRGFPILFKLDENGEINFIKLFGFYPKFDNDDRNDEINFNKLPKLDKIEFFYKFSGFLGQVITFEHNNELYWAACSKNSANSENNIFIKDAKRIFEKNLTKEILLKINTEG